jgi:hypothetical protein
MLPVAMLADDFEMVDSDSRQVNMRVCPNRMANKLGT